MDKELQSRSGRNIGIEPSLLPFVQAAAAEVTVIPLAGDVVLMEHTDQAARVLNGVTFPGGPGTPLCGVVFNTGPTINNTIVGIHFIDELGNDIPIGGGALGSGQNGMVTVPGENFSFFCLAPGEKIVARIEPNPGR